MSARLGRSFAHRPRLPKLHPLRGRYRSLLKRRFDEPLTTHLRLNAGDFHLTRIIDRFPTEVKIVGDGLSRYWFGIVNEGRVLLHQGAHAAVASGTMGLALRGLPGTTLLGTDHNVRTSLWVEADALALQLHFPEVCVAGSGLMGTAPA